jgi:hypothetical protein
MHRTSISIAAGICLFAHAAILGGCSPTREASAPAPGNATPPGPRYVCDYDPDPGNTPECDLESNVVSGPADVGTMRMLEVTRYPGLEPTPAQKKAAEDLIRRCYASAEAHGWFDFARATADGFKLKVSDETHYNNVDFLFDNQVLDPDRPEYLMFYDTPGGKALVGFMFVPRSNTEEGPQIGGPLTRWHYHTWWKPICLVKGILDMGPVVDGTCDVGSPSYRSPEMMHVWLLNHPQGPFATGMYLSPELLDRLLREREEQKGRARS